MSSIVCLSRNKRIYYFQVTVVNHGEITVFNLWAKSGIEAVSKIRKILGSACISIHKIEKLSFDTNSIHYVGNISNGTIH